MSTAYEHILWVTDLLDDNHRVGERAVRLARIDGARVSLLHVVDNVPLYLGEEMVLPETLEIERILEDKATERIAEFARRHGLDASATHVEVGPIKGAIFEFASRESVDLIVIGSHSRKGLAKLLGSTAKAVVDGAPCDVLVVRL